MGIFISLNWFLPGISAAVTNVYVLGIFGGRRMPVRRPFDTGDRMEAAKRVPLTKTSSMYTYLVYEINRLLTTVITFSIICPLIPGQIGREISL